MSWQCSDFVATVESVLGRKKNLGGKVRLWINVGDTALLSTLLFGSRFHLFRYKVLSPLSLGSYLFCLYQELALADRPSLLFSEVCSSLC